MYLCIFTTGSKFWEEKKILTRLRGPKESDLDLLRHSKNLEYDVWSITPSRLAHRGTHTHIKATLLGLCQFTFTGRAALSHAAFAAMVSDMYVSDMQ